MAQAFQGDNRSLARYSMRLMVIGILFLLAGWAALRASDSEIRGPGRAGIAAGAVGLLMLGAGLARGVTVELPEPPPPPPADLAAVKARAGALGLALPEDAVLGRVLGRLVKGRKIEAIRILRVATGRDLKDSKQAVDAMERILREAHPPGS
jgi:hypothetical protein